MSEIQKKVFFTEDGREIKLEILPSFSSGKFGILYVLNRYDHESFSTKVKCCLKQVKIKNQDVEAMFDSEIEILKACKHKHILKVFDSFKTIENGIKYGCIIDVATDLWTLVGDENISYDENQAKRLMHNVLTALNHMHNLGYCHRDIKLENILIEFKDSEIEGTLADFGFAAKFNASTSFNDIKGTEGYIAPEILKNQPYDYRCDYWSFGIVLYCTLYRAAPYDRARYLQQINDPWYRVYYDNSVSSAANDLIRGFLKEDPNARTTFDEALRDPWFEDIYESDVPTADELQPELDSQPVFL